VTGFSSFFCSTPDEKMETLRETFETMREKQKRQSIRGGTKGLFNRNCGRFHLVIVGIFTAFVELATFF
jgi:hypothetical protein